MFYLYALLGWICATATALPAITPPASSYACSFEEHPYLSSKMRKAIRPHLLPKDHPAKLFLDQIFSKVNALENNRYLAKAGFKTISTNTSSCIRVAKHPDLPGYVFKFYLNTDHAVIRNNIAPWQALVDRCVGAKKIRRLIKRKNLRYFTVPNKWLYVLPAELLAIIKPNQKRQVVLLVATDMQPVSLKKSIQAWKYVPTEEHLDELYSILSHGYSSTYLKTNVPYTIHGTFTCLDTESPKHINDFGQVEKHISRQMVSYWRYLQNSDPRNSNYLLW